MELEKNAIFLYPLSKVLQELQTLLEEDESFTVYEMDSVAEYGQLIGVMELSITFSSDLKKTESYLETCKQFVKDKTSKNILVQDNTLPPHTFGRLQRLGLNEGLKSDIKLKNLAHKVNFFFTALEQELKKEEEEKNKSIPENFVNKQVVASTDKQDKKKDHSNEILRVEKMAVLDEENPELKLKKIKTFNSVDAPSKKKQSNFVPVEQEYGNNPHKNLGLKEGGELNRKKSKNLNLAGPKLARRNAKFVEVEKELNRKKNKFDEIERNMNKKPIKFEEVLNDLKKKRSRFDESESEPKKKKLFEEVLGEYEKKRAKLEEVDSDLGKKRKTFDEIAPELERKKHAFEELDVDNPKKGEILLELEELQKKKHAALAEIEIELKKKHVFIEQELNPKNLPRHNFDEAEVEKKKKHDSFLDADYEKKKHGTFEDESEINKKQSKFEDVEKDLKKKPSSFEEVSAEKKQKTSRFDEVEKEKELRKTEIIDIEHEKKDRGKFEEVNLDSAKKKNADLDELKNKTIGEKNQKLNDEKKQEEQILDYSKFKKHRRSGEFSEDESEEKELAKKKLQEILDEPEYNYFDNESYGIEYLILYNDFLLKEEVSNLNLFKFIHFGLIKEFDGDISFYLADQNNTDLPLRTLYCGHLARSNKILSNDFEEYERENIARWLNQKLPIWKDETYQVEINEFIYPFYEDGVVLGVAVCHFKNTIVSHIDAHKVELLIMTLKGAVLDENSLGVKENA